MTEPPAGPPEPEGYDPDLSPATISHVRALRRLLAAVAIWAVGASVIAVIALVEEDPEPPRRDSSLGLTTRIAEVERSLERRIEALEERMGGAAGAGDLERLDRQVDRARRDTADAVEAARELNDGLETLQERVEALEERVGELEESQEPTGGGQP